MVSVRVDEIIEIHYYHEHNKRNNRRSRRQTSNYHRVRQWGNCDYGGRCMSAFGGPNVVDDGLILALDPANLKSYPGSGTTWFDRSGNDNNGTLTNGPTFDGGNLGSISFDGVDDYISIPYSATMDFSLAQTIIMWMKPGTGSNSTRRNPYNQAYGGSGTITHEPAANFNYFFGTHGGNNTPYVGIGSSFTVNPNELAFIAVTRSQPLNICRWYKNGARTVNTSAGGYAATNNGSSAILLANGYTNEFIGNIYYVLVYNRFFTDEEILQTYNATKGRFGL